MKEKIHKVLAQAGYGSRREIEQWIREGRVSVNGRPATLGARVSERDRISVDGRQAEIRGSRGRAPRILMYHKPEGEVCTRSNSEKRPTVFRNLPRLSGARWVSVGRLDINTSGLMLFTDDGELANRMMHPSSGLEREYLVRVRGRVGEKDLHRLKSGIPLDGREARFERVAAAGKPGDGQNQWYRIVICEGRYREVRRMWEAVGCQVSRLKRIRYGTVRLPRNLKQGEYVKLAPAQQQKLLRRLQDVPAERSGEQRDNRAPKKAGAGRRKSG